MNEVICGNGLAGLCTLSSQSSRWRLAMICFFPRMRTVWGTPQWGSMGWTWGRITNGWNEWVLMMQFVDDGWMRLFQKMVCLLQGQGFGGGPLIWGLRELGWCFSSPCLWLIHSFSRHLFGPNSVSLCKVLKSPEWKDSLCPEGAQ